MNRRLVLRAPHLGLALLLTALGFAAHAQVARSVPRGEVSGAELQIDGSLAAFRGHPMRFSFTTFEVLGLDRLRRVRGATVRVFASYSREHAVAELTTDAHGRALAVLDIPADAPGAFGIVLEVRTPSRVTRRFEFAVPVAEPRELRLTMTPSSVYPGSPLHVRGRLVDLPSERAIAGADVVVEIVGPRGPLGTAEHVVTDANGSFRRDVVLPSDAPLGSYSVSARIAGDHPLGATAAASVTARDAPTLLVSIAPSARIVRPRAYVDLDVVVRRPDGRPVPGATVSTTVREEDRSTATTDARGRARLRYRVLSASVGLVDERVDVRVDRAGLGSATAGTTVRVTGDDYAGRISFEGGRFAASLGGRAYVRVVGSDGRPAAAGVPVVLSGPRLRGGEVRVSTDAFGVATADLEIAPARTAPSAEEAESVDSCGGSVTTEIDAVIGEGAYAARLERCLPLDPDGVLRIRTETPRVRAGDSLAVRIDRASSVARVPVVLELVDAGTRRFGAVLASVTVPGEAASGTLAVPNDTMGKLWVRARLLHGADALEVRGASIALLASPRAPFRISGTFDRETGAVDVSFDGEPGAEVALYAMAVPYEQAIAVQRGYDYRQQYVGPSPADADTFARGESWLLAQLADQVPSDEIAANALLDGAVTPQPGPESPEEFGRLRDPYRARARFVQGRLALLFRAVESFLDTNVPGQPSTVAHRVNGHLEFNDAVLSAVASDGALGPEGATGLGGAPISTAQLRTIDPSFGYDAVARRVTRKRLFRLLLEMRSFVTQHDFDLAWARPGDPRVWLERMVTEGNGHYGSLEARSMVDGWGNAFQLVPTARPRFGMLQPVVGYEIVSAGPDGRYGNGDDIFDPTARVLPQGSTYALAVGEDALVARLRGVELSRASLGQVSELFGVYASGVPYGDDGDGSLVGRSEASPAFPSIVEIDPEPLAIRRYTETVPSVVVGPIARTTGNARLVLDLGTEPRSWGVFVHAVTTSGEVVTTMVRATSGTSALTHGEFPARLLAGEPLAVELAVTNVSSSARTYQLVTSTCPGATVNVPASLTVGAEESVPLRATMRATAVGNCPLRVDVVEAGRVLSSFARTVHVSSGLHPERRRTSALVASQSVSLDIAAPSGATRVDGRLTVVDPASLAELPELSQLHASNPSLIAWARVTAGRGFDDALRGEVLRSFEDPTQTASSLTRALAVVSLSARVDDEPARLLRDRLLRELGGSSSDSVPASDGASAHRRLVSAVVAALALSGVPDPDSTGSDDAIGSLFRRLLPELRASVRAEVGSPTELAFPAAALLLADAHDGHGRALFERAFAATETHGGERWLESATGREAVEGTAATLALAIAARELGREADSLALAHSGLRGVAALGRGSQDTAFWLVALGVYGTLANEDVAEVEVSIDGRVERHRLEQGRVSFPVRMHGGDRVSIQVRGLDGALVVAESEVAYEVPFVAESRGPLALALEGDVGRAYGVAALELTVTSSEAVFDPIVEIELPACVALDGPLEQALRASGVVRDVEMRRGGFVRLSLRALGPNATARIALPLAFRATGTMTGLAMSAYPATESYRRTVLPARELHLVGE